MEKTKLILFMVILVLFALSTALFYMENLSPPDLVPTPTSYSTLKPEPLIIEVTVNPWGSMYRTEPDCKEDFSVELIHPNQNETFTTDKVDISFNAGAFYWVVEKAFFTSDLFSGERWIDVSKNQYTIDLQKTFTFDLANVPNGNHYLSLTVIFHNGTRNSSTVYFKVIQ